MYEEESATGINPNEPSEKEILIEEQCGKRRKFNRLSSEKSPVTEKLLRRCVNRPWNEWVTQPTKSEDQGDNVSANEIRQRGTGGEIVSYF